MLACRQAGADDLRSSLQARERLGSTAIGHGIAIPHGRSSTLEAPRGALLRLEPAVDFNAGRWPGGRSGIRDGRARSLHPPAPDAAVGAGRTLFRRTDFRAALRSAPDAQAMRTLLLDEATITRKPRMTTSITARELFDQQKDKLALRWLAGLKGDQRMLEAVDTIARRPSLAGYLNAIYPNKVQILGSEELAWLDSLDSRQRWETIEKIIQYRPLALVISKNQSCPEDLRDAAEESETPLWISPKRGHELLNHLSYHMARTLAPRVTLHGVFMEIYSIGVLITGEAGSGKSELALELLSRGHRLVADDAPEFTQIAPDVLDGTCPELLQDLLEVRGLGVLNVRDMFGDTAVKKNKYLRLIVHLTRPMTEPNPHGYERLTGDSGSRHVLDLDVPLITLPVMPGRNLAVLTEAATRLHILRTKGIDPAAMFIARHSNLLERSSP